MKRKKKSSDSGSICPRAWASERSRFSRKARQVADHQPRVIQGRLSRNRDHAHSRRFRANRRPDCLRPIRCRKPGTRPGNREQFRK